MNNLFGPGQNKRESFARIGMEQQPLLIVDDIFAGADILKDYAIQNNNFSPSGSYYPGVRMPILSAYTKALMKTLAKHIVESFGLELQKIKSAKSAYSIVSTPVQHLTMLQKIPHFDAPDANSLAIVHYLCPEHYFGTALYRHNQTGFEYVDTHRYDNYMKIVKAQFGDANSLPAEYIDDSTDAYTQIETAELKYNRVVAYHGSSLHSGIIPDDYSFDLSPETGRLTVTTFVEFEPKELAVGET
jgi:hypothetical protein